MKNYESIDNTANLVEGANVPEAARQQSVGMVLVVLAGDTLDSEDPKVALIRELQSKPITERQAGQFSLPAETRKHGENEMENLLGAVAELTGSDDALGQLNVIPQMFIATGFIRVAGKPADVAFMIYDGSTTQQLTPLNTSEVENGGWGSIRKLQRMNGEVRSLSHDTLEEVVSRRILESIRANRHLAVPLSDYLERDFSIAGFIKTREGDTSQTDLLQ